MSEYLPEGKLILTQDNINTLHSFSLLSDAKKEGKILEARACVCDAEHNLIVDLGIMKGKPQNRCPGRLGTFWLP